MLRRFVPGTIDYNGLMAANYQQGRALSPQATDAWRAALAPFVPPAIMSLNGCCLTKVRP